MFRCWFFRLCFRLPQRFLWDPHGAGGGGGGGGGSVAEEVESWIPSPASSRSMLNLPIYILGYRRTFWKAFNIETTKKVTLKEISL